MKIDTINEFQDNVSDVLIRHKSIIDVITKFQESCARVNRAVVKSASSCGCVEIHAKVQELPSDISYEDLQHYLNNHLSGELCDICRDKIEEELGNHLFYLAAICSTLDLNLKDIIDKQWKGIKALGKFSLY
jgi:predicted house-cleaning noncanonical NTP pyrophosphatase (MazG superfamily)